MDKYFEKVINRQSLNEDDLKKLNTYDTKKLFKLSNELRSEFCGNKGELCSIMNIKSGHCSEDCKFCAQSAHYNTNIESYDLKSKNEILERALELEKNGVKRFSIVSSGKGIKDEEFPKLLEIIELLKEKTSLKLCASLGIIDTKTLLKLKEAGLSRYHHNVETSYRYYKNICTSHSYESRIECIKNAQEVGLEVCSGFIAGLGESIDDIIDISILLRNLNINSIPINLLNPIPNTPFENSDIMSAEEYFKIVSIVRFVNPKAWIRYAGGRGLIGDNQRKGLSAGINSSITGELLTTNGGSIEDDFLMFKEMGFDLI